MHGRETTPPAYVQRVIFIILIEVAQLLSWWWWRGVEDFASGEKTCLHVTRMLRFCYKRSARSVCLQFGSLNHNLWTAKKPSRKDIEMGHGKTWQYKARLMSPRTHSGAHTHIHIHTDRHILDLATFFYCGCLLGQKAPSLIFGSVLFSFFSSLLSSAWVTRDQFEPTRLVAASEANSGIFLMVFLWSHSSARTIWDLFGMYICKNLSFSLVIMNSPLSRPLSSKMTDCKISSNDFESYIKSSFALR